MRPRWLVYLRLGRVSNLPTVWTNCLAGIVLAGALPDPAAFTTFAAAISLLYVSGMYLNDAFDESYDRRHRAERPIPSGEITAVSVYSIGFALMLAGLALLFFFYASAVWWGVGLAALIVFYDWRHKNIAISPVVMALCRVMVYLCAAATVGAVLEQKVIGGAIVLMAYMIGLSYVAKQENLTEIKNLWPVALLIAPFLYAVPLLLRPSVQTVLYILFLLWVVYSLAPLFAKRKNIPRAVVSLIAGISLLDGVLIASVAPESLWSWIGLAGVALTVLFQRYVPGT